MGEPAKGSIEQMERQSHLSDLIGIKNTDARAMWVIGQLCGEPVPVDVFESWYGDEECDDLQHWVSSRLPAGIMAIAVIEAAERVAQEYEE